jgi:hypothetical protein
MVKRSEWKSRKFNFDFPVGLFSCILERLRGTPMRLEELVGGLSDEELKRKPAHGWSIQEHVGHLSMVEQLWDIRIDDFLAGKEELHPADLSGRHTDEADFRKQDIGNILARFRKVRGDLVERLEQFDDESAARSAHHERLNMSMRVVDLAYFAAEHDDNHLASIRELIRG